MSTYHASSGPESRARNTPCRASAAKNTQKVSAAISSAQDARLTTADASSTGRRPIASASPWALQGEDDEALGGDDDADLRHAHAPLQEQQGQHADDEADREPPGSR